MTTEYKELTEAVDALNLTLTATVTDPGDINTPSKWGVNLCRNGRNYSTDYTLGAAYREQRVRRGAPWKPVPFRGANGSYENRPTTPKLLDVLNCLVMDAGCIRHGQRLSDFGADLGYTDLQKGVEAYEGCMASWRGLVHLGLDLDALDTIFQDY